ncbi:DUF5131 family protein [Streptomyces sp. NPDC059071]|uniref:DUF5131 family protein n=1 Tax=unclassified Streptomyces TaxID=2593676 RepID=UPI003661FBA5
MATNTSIEWADKTWSPLIGCTRVSAGCDNCYAISTARIRSANPNPAIANAFAGTVDHIGGRLDWTGLINQLEDRLTTPLTWRKPRKVFVNSQSDLFHQNVDHTFIARVLAIVALTPQHTYQVLTKRHSRMRTVLTDACTCGNGHAPGIHLRSAMAWAVSKANPNRIPGVPDDAEHRVYNAPWPLPNLWLGVSVENQQWANIRIPALLDTPAAVRWISAEPLLGPVDLHPWLKRPQVPACDRCAPPGPLDYHSDHLWGRCTCSCHPARPSLHWVVAGGESGHGARPAHPEWFRTLRDQCAAAHVPYLFKQWGAYKPTGRIGIGAAEKGYVLIGPQVDALGHRVEMQHVGKKAAGRELDGRIHDDYPTPAA